MILVGMVSSRGANPMLAAEIIGAALEEGAVASFDGIMRLLHRERPRLPV